MNIDNRSILLKILEAIDFADDKEAFADEFLKNVQTQTVVDLFQSLPSDKQEELKKQLAEDPNNPEKASEVFSTYFGEEQRKSAFEEASKNAMLSWMQEINPTLSDAQRQKLIDLSSELNPTPPPSQ